MLLETYVRCKSTFLMTKNMAACEEKVMHLRSTATDLKYKNINYIWSGPKYFDFLIIANRTMPRTNTGLL